MKITIPAKNEPMPNELAKVVRYRGEVVIVSKGSQQLLASVGDVVEFKGTAVVGVLKGGAYKQATEPAESEAPVQEVPSEEVGEVAEAGEPVEVTENKPVKKKTAKKKTSKKAAKKTTK